MEPFAQAERLVQSRLTLSDFVHWLSASSWRSDSVSEPDLGEFLGRLEDRIYEFTAGVASEQEVKRAIRADLRLLTVGLRDMSHAELRDFVASSITLFGKGEISFNDLLGYFGFVIGFLEERLEERRDPRDVALKLQLTSLLALMERGASTSDSELVARLHLDLKRARPEQKSPLTV